MKLAIAVLAALPIVAFGQDSPDRVQAKEPTVVNVHGQSDAVRQQEKTSSVRKEKRGRGFLAKLTTGPEWFGFSDNDVIPSSRERTANAAYRK